MTQAPRPFLSATGRRRTARDREFRRLRILAMAQAGWSYAAIGREAAISRERVRQIVANAFKAGERATKLVHARVQIARLEPALRLAARSVADAAYDEGGREKLLAKLNRMAENIQRRRALHGGAAPGENDSLDAEDSTIAEAALDAPQTVDS